MNNQGDPIAKTTAASDGEDSKNRNDAAVAGELRDLLCQYDNILNSRINILLVAETIFFAGASSVGQPFLVVLILDLLGCATAVMFTVVNLRLYWRIVGLIDRYKKESQIFHDAYLVTNFADLNFGSISGRIKRRLGVGNQRRWLDSGSILTWGLLLLLLLAWLALGLFAYFSQPGK